MSGLRESEVSKGLVGRGKHCRMIQILNTILQSPGHVPDNDVGTANLADGSRRGQDSKQLPAQVDIAPAELSLRLSLGQTLQVGSGLTVVSKTPWT